jgi:hypothetical protein
MGSVSLWPTGRQLITRRGEFVMSDNATDKKTEKVAPVKTPASAQPNKRASSEERRAKRVAELNGQQAELKRQAQERREQRGMKTV